MAKRPALHPAAPPGQTLTAIAVDLLRDARAAIIDPALPTDEAVHDFRKAIKRWRAFLRLVEPYAGEDARNLRQAARDSARKLGRARDLRAALDALGDLRGRRGPNEATLAGARSRIESHLAEAETLEADRPLREAAGHEVLLWQQAISRWDLAAIGFDEFATAMSAGYRRARRAAPKRLVTADDDALHRFRKRVIDHRYQMELAKPFWPHVAKRRIDDAQRLRDALGQHRDLALLRAMTEDKKPLQEFYGDLLPAIARRRKAHLARAETLAARLFAERPREFREQLREGWRALGS